MERANERLWLVVPLTFAIVVLLLYINFRSLTAVFIILVTLPLGLIGGIWLLYLLGYHLTVPATIGFIALGGVAVEIGVVMMMYLDKALTRGDVRDAVMEGALLWLRPVTMTKVANIAVLLPILLGAGAGSEAMQRISAPMVGGMVTVAILTLAVIPASYLVWKTMNLDR